MIRMIRILETLACDACPPENPPPPRFNATQPSTLCNSEEGLCDVLTESVVHRTMIFMTTGLFMTATSATGTVPEQ